MYILKNAIKKDFEESYCGKCFYCEELSNEELEYILHDIEKIRNEGIDNDCIGMRSKNKERYFGEKKWKYR